MTIGGQMSEVQPRHLQQSWGLSINLERAEIGKEIFLIHTNLDGGPKLSFAKAASWYDSARVRLAPTAACEPVRGSSGRLRRRRTRNVALPAKDQLWLRGFTYNDIAADPPVGVKRRLEWLRRDHDHFIPQPYEQLAGVYRREGNEHDARKVLISAQVRRHIAGLAIKGIWDVLLAPAIPGDG